MFWLPVPPTVMPRRVGAGPSEGGRPMSGRTAERTAGVLRPCRFCPSALPCRASVTGSRHSFVEVTHESILHETIRRPRGVLLVGGIRGRLPRLHGQQLRDGGMLL